MTTRMAQHTINQEAEGILRSYVFLVRGDHPFTQDRSSRKSITEQKLDWAWKAWHSGHAELLKVTSTDLSTGFIECITLHPNKEISVYGLEQPDGRRHDVWTFYDIKGEVVAKGPYANGQKHGAWYEAEDRDAFCWHQNGELIFRTDMDKIIAALSRPQNLTEAFKVTAEIAPKIAEAFDRLITNLAQDTTQRPAIAQLETPSA